MKKYSSNNLTQKNRTNSQLLRMFTFVSALILVAVLAASVFTNLFSKADASGIANSVIVELKDDPAAVWKAKMEKSGGSVSDSQLERSDEPICHHI